MDGALLSAIVWVLMVTGCNQITGIRDFTFGEVDSNIGDDTSTSTQADSDTSEDTSDDTNTVSDTTTDTINQQCIAGVEDSRECNDDGDVVSVDECGDVIEVVVDCAQGNVCSLGVCTCPVGWSGNGCDVPVVYVDIANGGSANNDGSSWEKAFDDLQDALTLASLKDSCEIWVAKGVYIPGQTTAATYQLIDDVHIYGGFNGEEVIRPERDVVANKTILSGDVNGDDVTWFQKYEDNVYHVVTGSNDLKNVILDGFVISHGNAVATTDDGVDFGDVGGGILLGSGDVIVENCTFDGNRALTSGGALFSQGTAQLISCIFQNNDATLSGGAASVNGSEKIFDSSFTNNSSTSGGAMAATGNITLDKCLFNGNRATSKGEGGAVWVGDGTLQVKRSGFNGNTADANGGAIGIAVGAGVTRVVNSVFSGNESLGNGGAISGAEVIVENGIFISNYADISGGAMAGGISAITNCTIVNNSAKASGGAVSIEASVIRNTIFWGNKVAADSTVIGFGTGVTTLSFCVVEGGCSSFPDGTCGEGVLDDDPRLVNINSGNVMLSDVSPCIDAGSNASVSKDELDLDDDNNIGENIPFDNVGNERVVDGDVDDLKVVDIGAIEFHQ